MLSHCFACHCLTIVILPTSADFVYGCTELCSYDDSHVVHPSFKTNKIKNLY